MHCILITGIPAAGKSEMARFLGRELGLPVLSKDRIKELLYDTVGFQSRAEKVRLGTASMEIMYDMAEQLMASRQAFIWENNFENASREGLTRILDRHGYQAVTVLMTGDYPTLYRRFLERNRSPDRHRGHVVNDRYPEGERTAPPKDLSFEDFAGGIAARGMDCFSVRGPRITVDTTDFARVDRQAVLENIRGLLREQEGAAPCFT